LKIDRPARELARKIGVTPGILMTAPTFCLVAVLVLVAAPPAAPAHDANPAFAALLSQGWAVGDASVAFPDSTLADDASEEKEREVLRSIAGPGKAVEEFARDSVTAPIVLKTRDQPVGSDGVIRLADLYFVVHADLGDLDPDRTPAAFPDGKNTEAGNMEFSATRLTGAQLDERGLSPKGEGQTTRMWFVHLKGRLLDRIELESTDRVTGSKSDRSWVFASRTDPGFQNDREFPNRWRPVARRGAKEEAGEYRPYPGGAGYLKVTRSATVRGALFVEAHSAFFEPRGWFEGAPFLKSKFALVAQDRVRGLRSEIKSRVKQREAK
jgi:hypothetical protein